MKIAILYICTGKYHIFWKDFFESAEKFLLPQKEKHYFVFTDTTHIFEETNPGVHNIKQAALRWPFATLLRFDMFRQIEPELKGFDYIYFFNANMHFVAPVQTEIFPSDEEGGLTVVKHPGFYNRPRNEFTYECDPNSLAYIACKEGEHYVAGGFNGGKSVPYMNLVQTLKRNIETDLEKGIIAVWHDESHLNRYIIGKKVRILSPSYCYPEGWRLPFEPKIIVKDKMKYGGHSALRNIET
jgi:hypothetical protein